MLDVPEPAVTAPTTATEEPPRSRRQRLIGFACSVGIFLVCYVLAAGPMSWVHKVVPFKPFRTAIEYVFAPIVWLTKHNLEPISSMIKAYVRLFR